MTRVLYWVQSFLPSIGGVQILAGKLLPALRERGFEFTVVASHDFTDLPDVTDWNGIPVHRFPFREALEGKDPLRLLETRKKVESLKQAFQPDLVHVNLTDPSVFFHLQTTPSDPPPFLLTTRMAMRQESAGPDTVLGKALRGADRVTTISQAMLENLLQLVPEIREKSSVVYNGLEPPVLEPTPLPMAPPHLLCLGRMAEEKGWDVALRALPLIAQEFPGVRMTFAGDGPAMERLKELSGALSLDDRVTFASWVDPGQVPTLINESTLMLVPSRWWEGFGLVALQGHQLGRPVVASRVGGLAEVVADGVTGHLVEMGNHKALATATMELLGHPARLKAMGEAAQERADRMFSWGAHVDTYARIYSEMTRG